MINLNYLIQIDAFCQVPYWDPFLWLIKSWTQRGRVHWHFPWTWIGFVTSFSNRMEWKWCQMISCLGVQSYMDSTFPLLDQSLHVWNPTLLRIPRFKLANLKKGNIEWQKYGERAVSFQPWTVTSCIQLTEWSHLLPCASRIPSSAEPRRFLTCKLMNKWNLFLNPLILEQFVTHWWIGNLYSLLKIEFGNLIQASCFLCVCVMHHEREVKFSLFWNVCLVQHLPKAQWLFLYLDEDYVSLLKALN